MLYLLRDRNFLKIFVIILAITILYSSAPLKIKAIQSIKLKTQDAFYNLRYNLKKSIPGIQDLVIIAIDDESYRVLDRKWPWSRDVFAALIRKLKKASPSVIGMDLAFVGESGDSVTDDSLANEMLDAGNVIIAAYFSKEGKYVLPDKLIRDSAADFGFINKPRDIDYVVRRARSVMFSRSGNKIDNSFGLEIAARHLGVAADKITVKPINKINYSAKPESFKTFSFWKVIADEVNPAELKDKIVLVGMTAEIFHDVYQTPLGLSPGVLINANEILTYLNKSFIKDVNDWVNLLLQFFLALLILLISYKAGFLKGAIALIGFFIISFTANLWALFLGFSLDFFGMAFVLAGSYIATYAYKNIGLLIDNVILRKEAITDGLTGLYVYRYFELKLRNDFRRAKELKENLSLIILDIDHFKPINDTYGHEEGNIILKDLAQVIMSFSRKTDTVCRYGGEEFCVILPDTSIQDASHYAENLRQAVEKHNFVISKGPLKVTISLGVATLKPNINDPSELIKLSDAALYRAKESGRNRVIS